MKSFRETVQENAAAPSRIRQGVRYTEIGHVNVAYILYAWDGRKLFLSPKFPPVTRVADGHTHFDYFGREQGIEEIDDFVTGRYEFGTGRLSMNAPLGFNLPISKKFADALFNRLPEIREVYFYGPNDWTGKASSLHDLMEQKQRLDELNVETVKGWWKVGESDPYLFSSRMEHFEAIIKKDKEIARWVKTSGYDWNDLEEILAYAMEEGWVRFGRISGSVHGKHFFIQLSAFVPKVWYTVMKIIKWFDIDNDDKVAISTNNYNVFGNYELGKDSVMTGAEARKYVQERINHGRAQTMTAAESAGVARSRRITNYLDIGHTGESPYHLYFFDGTQRKLYISPEQGAEMDYDHNKFLKGKGLLYNGSEISGRYETDTGLLSIALGSDYRFKGKRIPSKLIDKLIEKFPNIKDIYITKRDGEFVKTTFTDILNESPYTQYFSMWWKNGESEPLYMWNDEKEHAEVIIRLVPSLFTGAYEKVKEDPYQYWKIIVFRAVRNGYIRVGKFDTSIHGKELFIQFDPKVKGIWKTVYKILKWVEIDNDEQVLLIRGANPESPSSFMTKAEAMRFAAQSSKGIKTAVA